MGVGGNQQLSEGFCRRKLYVFIRLHRPVCHRVPRSYKCAGIHGMGIKFLEAVLAEKNIHIIQGKSQECDIYESSNGSTLVEHYKKLGFEVDFQEDGSYTITKYVTPEPSIDISKPENLRTK